VLEQPGDTGRDNPTQGMPTWVKGFAIATAVLVVLVVMLLTGGHGPADTHRADRRRRLSVRARARIWLVSWRHT